MIKVSEASLKLDFSEYHQADGSAFSEYVKNCIQYIERGPIEQKIESELNNLSLVKIKSNLRSDVGTFYQIQRKIIHLLFGTNGVEWHFQFSTNFIDEQLTKYLNKFSSS